MSNSTPSKAKAKPPLPIVVMGLDSDGRSRAAAYTAEEAEVAAKAAQDWKLRLGKAESEAALMLTAKIPAGTLYPSAKMGPPAVKRETYNLLMKTVVCEDAAGPSPEPAAKEAPRTEPFNPWNELRLGDVVLWSVDREEGYFPAKIEAISKDRKTLSLRWKQWPSYPLVKAPRVAVGLIQVIK